MNQAIRHFVRPFIISATVLLLLTCARSILAEALPTLPGFGHGGIPRVKAPAGASTRELTSTNGWRLQWFARLAAPRADRDIFFVHGTPGEGGVWNTQYRSGLTNENLFSYDRPGFGGSQPARRRPHLQEQADALLELLNAATTNRVLLVGHSYGSPIALLTALEHPDRVRGVVLIGGDVDPAEEKPWWLQHVFGLRLLSWVVPQTLRQCNRELLTVKRDLIALGEKLPDLQVPVVMLHGDRDPLVPVSNVAWLERRLHGLGKDRLFAKIILPGVNHFIPWQHPADVERAVRRAESMADAAP